MKQTLLLLLLAGMVALSSSCSSTTAGVGLQTELTAIERASDGTATATVRIVNPNLVSYNVGSATHTIVLGNGSTGTLTVRKPTGVPAQATALQTGTLVPAKGSALSAGATTYRLDSRLELILWDEQKEEVKIQTSGSVTVK